MSEKIRSQLYYARASQKRIQHFLDGGQADHGIGVLTLKAGCRERAEAEAKRLGTLIDRLTQKVALAKLRARYPRG